MAAAKMQQAYRQAHIAVNQRVIAADRNRDFGGHSSPYTHAVDTYHEQYSAETQRNHFLRNTGEAQHDAYNHAVGQLRADAAEARNAIRGDQAAADTANGNAEHLIGDSYAHITRNANGEITHVQCFTCSGKEDDHHHPPEQTDGHNSTEFQGGVDASAAYVQMMQNAGTMTDEQFNQALNDFINKYEPQKLPEEKKKP